ncbi:MULTISPECIES: His-Xaa-Ser system protein HxsD [unclassified Azospirillum]|uniref:His-Xaa-Ser system protein HxsD n=1 Tax=unclassified Azospirillum TaxID=2630922 RepID=UPI000B6B9ADF|nr:MULTISPECIES: His-Xaa-Ser system protein HxsD [unclassified Azospirillum]SNS87995.1 His-Xaa-Ser system protein HxsD [Azospirillum sp. RU38E]SNT04955.1 His-Xaa-Ser system protein HxsD [Azospirillum sp. RU37A]
MPSDHLSGSLAGKPEIPFEAAFSVTIDLSVFPREVVLRACYAFADRCHCWVQGDGPGSLLVAFRDRTGKLDAADTKGAFANALVDFALRADIETRTADVRRILVATAMAEAAGTAALR